jgi:hypothetical protein
VTVPSTKFSVCHEDGRSESAVSVAGNLSVIAKDEQLESNNIEGFARLLHESFGLNVRTEGDRIVITAG